MTRPGELAAGLTLALFCAALLLCIALDLPILCALAFGLALFLGYGRRMGFAWPELARMAASGVWAVRNILIVFLLIGALTALWRAAGTIPAIVGYASALIRPSCFLFATFLLNCGLSLLTGTAFGTAATMGVICATMGAAMGVDTRLTGGAVLSGVFVGDRCSPVSTSALLVAELTGTDIFDNIRRMLRSGAVPFALCCVLYAGLGLFAGGAGEAPDLRALFGRAFNLHWAALTPAAVILALALLRVNVKLAMAASILTALPLCLFMQDARAADLPRLALSGFRAPDAALAAMLDGGGVVSMLKATGIVCLSASYSGIFHKTGLLDGATRALEALARRTSVFASVLCAAALSAMVACNQVLAVMLTSQLCAGLEKDDPPRFANDLEDTAVVVAPLAPWSIASGVPLAAIGAPISAIPLAFWLYLLPLWRLAWSLREKEQETPRAEMHEATPGEPDSPAPE